MTVAAGLPRLGIVVAGEGAITALEAYLVLREFSEPVFLVRELSDSLGGAAERSPLAWLSSRAKVVALPSDASAFAVVSGLRLAGLTTFSNEGVAACGALAQALGLPSLSAGSAGGLADKVEQRAALGSDIGPRFLVMPRGRLEAGRESWRDAARTLGFPAVLKPAVGQGSTGVVLVEDEDHLAKEWGSRLSLDRPSSERWLLERQLVGVDAFPRAGYLSVETAVSAGVHNHVAITRKLPLVTPFRELGQYVLPAQPEDEHDAEVLRVVSTALDRLQVRNAVTHTEVMLTAAGPKVIEVNGRIGGLIRDLVACARGIDLVPLAGRIALSREPIAVTPTPSGSFDDLIFQYAPLAPVVPGVLVESVGIQDVVAWPGVSTYHPHVRAGQETRGGAQTTTLGVFLGRCGDEEELAAVVREIEATLTYVFRTPKGELRSFDARGTPVGA